eukprot:537738-Pleurochrysis_carterae.AAC.1
MDGKNEHVNMSTHHDLAKLAHMHGVGRVYFEQCVFGASSSKTTQLIASADLLAQLELRFAEKFCPHPPGTHNGEPYRTRAAQSYPADMNAALADTLIVSLLPPTAVLRDAGVVSEDDWFKDEFTGIFTLCNEGDTDASVAMGLK